MKASITALLLLGVGGCTTAELAVDLAKKQKFKKEQAEGQQIIANPHYKIGNPYQIDGIWYYPDRDLTYDKTGIASWYGDEFGGR